MSGVVDGARSMENNLIHGFDSDVKNPQWQKGGGGGGGGRMGEREKRKKIRTTKESRTKMIRIFM